MDGQTLQLEWVEFGEQVIPAPSPFVGGVIVFRWSTSTLKSIWFNHPKFGGIVYGCVSK